MGPRLGNRSVARGWCALGFIVASFVGCAALVPDRAPLTWRVVDLSRDDPPESGEIRWSYTIVIDNAGRSSATLIQRAVVLAWDGVSLSPAEIDLTRQRIEPGSQFRLSTTSVFRRSDFEESGRGSPGRPRDAPQDIKGMRISWQFLGRYERGDAMILNVDIVRDRFPRK